MSAALATSGTSAFQISNADIVLEAFERISVRPTSVTSEHMASARRSLNLELQTWSNRGVLLYAVTQGTIPLVIGQPTYLLPANCVQVLDTYYSTPATTGGVAGNNDRIMLPMTRTEYSEIPNKLTQAPPNRYWFERLAIPQMAIWQVWDGSGGAASINYSYLRQLQDANTYGSEAPDVLNRFLEALISGLAARLAEKWAPEREQAKRNQAQMAWNEATAEDREQGPLTIRPNFSRYSR